MPSSSSAALVIARYTVLEAARNRLSWVLAVLLAGGVGLAAFLGELAITETREFQSGLLAAVLRLGAVFVVSLFVVTSMLRELSDKGIEVVLSLPHPRSSYLLGKLAGFGAVAVGASVLCALAAALYAPAAAAAVWGVSLACELLLVAALSLLCVLTFNQATSALSAVAAFYLAARVIPALQLMARGPFADPQSLAHRFASGLLDALAFVLPSLNRFTESAWLVYPDTQPGVLLLVLGQSAVYLLLLGAAALFDLYRKDL